MLRVWLLHPTLIRALIYSYLVSTLYLFLTVSSCLEIGV